MQKCWIIVQHEAVLVLLLPGFQRVFPLLINPFQRTGDHSAISKNVKWYTVIIWYSGRHCWAYISKQTHHVT